MSYTIVKHIKVDEKEGKVSGKCSCNNVFPKDYSYYQEFPSLSKLLREKGKQAVELEIFKAYESGCFQGGNKKYVNALKRLKNMPEYEKFDWRRTNYSWEESRKIKEENGWDDLLIEALTSKMPSEKYVVSKMYGSTKVFAQKQTKWKLFWTYRKDKAKIFHFKNECERLKSCFQDSDDWEIEKIPTKNECSKTVTRENAYEVWRSLDNTWTWYVLKKWQIDDDKQYARWFCDVVTPICPDGELGDVYVSEIRKNARRIK